MIGSRLLAPIVLASSLLLITPGAYGQSPPDLCMLKLPAPLQETIKQQEPHGRIASVAELNPRQGARFEANYPGRCPGVAKLNVRRNNGRVYALVLTTAPSGSTVSHLVVAHETAAGHWELITVEKNVQGWVPMVITAPASQYKTTRDDKAEVIVFFIYGGWTTVCEWDGQKIKVIAYGD